MRRASALLVAAAVAIAGLLAPAPALAADGPRVIVHRADPLMSDPLRLEITALTADGSAAAFSGTATVATGKAASSVPIAATAGATAITTVPTARLHAGWSVLTLRITVAGRAVKRTYPWFAEIVPSLSVSGFGCAAMTKSGGTVRWAVDRMAGTPVRTPNSRDLPLLPYVRSSSPRWTMTGTDGLPLATSGTMVVRSAARKVVARTALAKQVRRLVFAARAKGAFTAGTYTATLTLTDAAGRTLTAAQTVTVGGTPCGT